MEGCKQCTVHLVGLSLDEQQLFVDDHVGET